MAGRLVKARRILGRVLLLTALLLSVGLAVDLPGVRGLVDRRLEDLAMVVTGEPVRIDDVRIHLWPPALTVEGLVMGEPGGARIQADRVYLQPGLRGRQPVLAVLALERPRVRLVLDEEGLRGFTALRQGEATLAEFPWDELSVSSGYLEIELASLDASIQLEGLEVRPDVQPGRADLKMGAVAVRHRSTWQRSQPTRVLGAVLGPYDVVLPRVDLDFELVDVWGRIEKDLDGKGLADVQLDLDLDALAALLPGPMVPSGRVRVDLEVDGPSAEGSVLTEFALVDLDNGDRYDFEQAAGVVDLGPSGVVLQPLRWQWAEGELLIDGFVGWDGQVEALRVQGEGLDFARVMARTAVTEGAWVDFDADLEVQLDGTLVPLSLDGPFAVAATGLRTGAEPMEARGAEPLIALRSGSLEGSLHLVSDGITLRGDRTALGRTRGQVEAFIGFTPTGPLALSADVALDLRDLAPLSQVALAGRGRVMGELTGPFDQLQVSAEAWLRDLRLFDAPLGDSVHIGHVHVDLGAEAPVVALDGLSSTLGSTTLRGEAGLIFDTDFGVAVDLLVDHGGIADLIAPFASLPGLDGVVSGALSLSGPPDALDGQVDLMFHDVDLFGETFASGEGHGRLEAGEFLLDDALLRRAAGSGELRGQGTVAQGGALDLQVQGRGLALAEFDHLAGRADLVGGTVGLEVQVDGVLDDWRPRGRVWVGEATVLDEPVQDSQVQFETEEGLLVFSGDLVGRTVWGRGTVELEAPHALHLDGGLADLPLHLLAPRPVDGRALVALASGGLVLDGTLLDGDLYGELVLDQVRAAWGAQEVTNPAPWTVEWIDRGVRIPPVRLSGGATWLEAQGSWDSLAGWTLEGGGQLDLAWLGAVVPQVTRAAGTAQVGFHQDTDGAKLETSGTLSILQAAWFPHPFEDLTFSARGTQDHYEVRTVEGLVGGGTLVGAGGLEAAGWVPTRYDLAATLDEGRVQLVDDLPPITGDAALRLTGPPGGLLLSGDVTVTDMRFVERIDWESWLIEPGGELLVELEAPITAAPLFAYDLGVQADGTVLVRNNVGEGVLDADLHVLGDTNRVGMTGWVRMRPGGILSLQNRLFEVERAELRYADPWSFDPELDVALATRIPSGDTDYDITYRVGGLYSDWTTAASSEPSLPMADINALLLFGMTREQVERAGGINTALLIEGLDLATGVRQGRAEARLTTGRLDVLPDRIDLVTGMSPRGDAMSSDWRLLAQKELGDWTLTGDVNLADWDQRYWAIERDLAGAIYLTLYRASLEEESGLPVEGAWGADLVWRWELQ